jgi:hypothetical protein
VEGVAVKVFDDIPQRTQWICQSFHSLTLDEYKEDA